MKVFDKKYKNTLDKNMRLYRKKISLELRNLRKSNSKEYRKILNRGKMKTEPNITIESLFEYFNETPIEN
jgi:glutaredoxin